MVLSSRDEDGDIITVPVTVTASHLLSPVWSWSNRNFPCHRCPSTLLNPTLTPKPPPHLKPKPKSQLSMSPVPKHAFMHQRICGATSTHTRTHTQRERERERERDIERDRERQRERHRDTHKHTHTQTHRHTSGRVEPQAHTHTHTHISGRVEPHQKGQDCCWLQHRTRDGC